MDLTGYTCTAPEAEDIAARLDALRSAGCTAIIHEYANVSTRVRPELARAISHLRRGDELVVTDLDCVAWSLPQLFKLLTMLDDRGIIFRALESPIDTSGRKGRVVLDTLRAILSFNDALGRARIRQTPVPASTTRRIEVMEVAAGIVARQPGMTLREVASELKRLGYGPPKGGAEWTLSAIKLLLDRAKLTGILIER
jgi:resolvase-like protein